MDRDELTKDSSIYLLLEYLNVNIDDKCPREKISDFELGIKIGQLNVLDIIRGICNDKL